MCRKDRCEFVPHLTQDIPPPHPSMPQATELPFPNLVNLLCLDGVPVDIIEHHQELSESLDDPREEPITPYMADVSMNAVVRHGKHAQDPLQDTGEGFPAARADHEVEVIAHEGKILDPEVVPFPGPGDDLKEEILHAPVVQDHLFPVRPGGDVVQSSSSKFPWLTHTGDTLGESRFACVRQNELCPPGSTRSGLRRALSPGEFLVCAYQGYAREGLVCLRSTEG